MSAMGTRRQHHEQRDSVPLEESIDELNIVATNQPVMNGGGCAQHDGDFSGCIAGIAAADTTADDENSCDYDESDDNDSNRKYPIYELKETDIRANLQNVRSDTAASGFQTV